MDKKFSPEEVRAMKEAYRDAKDPVRQIGILADLHSVEPAVIRQVLGLKKPPPPRKFVTYPPELKDKVLDAIRWGLPPMQAAEQYGVNANTIYNWIARAKKKDMVVDMPPEFKAQGEVLKRWSADWAILQDALHCSDEEKAVVAGILVRADGFLAGLEYAAAAAVGNGWKTGGCDG